MLSGMLFLLEIAAFLLVAWWAYAEDRDLQAPGLRGLLAMKGHGEAAERSGSKSPSWKRRAAPPEEAPAIAGQPRWRRSPGPHGARS